MCQGQGTTEKWWYGHGDHDEWFCLQWNAVFDRFHGHPRPSPLTLAHTMLFVIYVKMGVFFVESFLRHYCDWICILKIKTNKIEVEMTVTPSPSAFEGLMMIDVSTPRRLSVILRPSSFDSAKRASGFDGQCWPWIGDLGNQEKCHNQLAHQGQTEKIKLGNWIMSWVSVLFWSWR